MNDDIVGPIDGVLLDFGAEQPLGEVADSLLGPIDAGMIRLYDIVAVRKDGDGSVSGVELANPVTGSALAVFSGARSGLLGDDDEVVPVSSSLPHAASTTAPTSTPITIRRSIPRP